MSDNLLPQPEEAVKKPSKKIVWWAVSLMLIALVFTVLLWYVTDWVWYLWWLLSINITAGTIFFLDKKRATKFPDDGAKRIPEAVLLWTCLIGGTIGGFATMLYAKHKTRDRKFLLYLTVIIIIQALVIGFLIARHLYSGGV